MKKTALLLILFTSATFSHAQDKMNCRELFFTSTVWSQEGRTVVISNKPIKIPYDSNLYEYAFNDSKHIDVAKDILDRELKKEIILFSEKNDSYKIIISLNKDEFRKFNTALRKEEIDYVSPKKIREDEKISKEENNFLPMNQRRDPPPVAPSYVLDTGFPLLDTDNRNLGPKKPIETKSFSLDSSDFKSGNKNSFRVLFDTKKISLEALVQRLKTSGISFEIIEKNENIEIEVLIHTAQIIPLSQISGFIKAEPN